MASELITGLGIFKTLFDMAKGLKDISDAAIRDRAVIELLEKLMAAQLQQTALVERVTELEKEKARFENWESEKQRYELADAGGGSSAYRLKPAMANGEPPHCICANCYQKAHKSILQPETRMPGRAQVLVCNECGSDFYVSGARAKEHSGARRPSRRV